MGSFLLGSYTTISMTVAGYTCFFLKFISLSIYIITYTQNIQSWKKFLFDMSRSFIMKFMPLDIPKHSANGKFSFFGLLQLRIIRLVLPSAERVLVTDYRN